MRRASVEDVLLPQLAERVLACPHRERVGFETAETGTSLFTVDDNDLLGLEMIEKLRGLRRDNYLSPVGGVPDHSGEDVQREGVEAEFRFVDDYGRGWVRLEEGRGEADESQCAVRQLPRLEGKRRPFLTPLETDDAIVPTFVGFEEEVVEKGCDKPYRLQNRGVVVRMFLPQPEQKGGDVRGVRGEFALVPRRMFAPHSGGERRIVKVVGRPARNGLVDADHRIGSVGGSTVSEFF